MSLVLSGTAVATLFILRKQVSASWNSGDASWVTFFISTVKQLTAALMFFPVWLSAHFFRSLITSDRLKEKLVESRQAAEVKMSVTFSLIKAFCSRVYPLSCFRYGSRVARCRAMNGGCACTNSAMVRMMLAAWVRESLWRSSSSRIISGCCSSVHSSRSIRLDTICSQCRKDAPRRCCSRAVVSSPSAAPCSSSRSRLTIQSPACSMAARSTICREIVRMWSLRATLGEVRGWTPRGLLLAVLQSTLEACERALMGNPRGEWAFGVATLLSLLARLRGNSAESALRFALWGL